MRHALAIVIALGALAGCSLLDPYETVPLKPVGGKDTRPRVGICFDKLANEPERVRVEADDACGPGMSAVREDTDYGLETMQVCPLLLPGRATFICVPKR